MSLAGKKNICQRSLYIYEIWNFIFLKILRRVDRQRFYTSRLIFIEIKESGELSNILGRNVFIVFDIYIFLADCHSSSRIIP